MTKKIGFLAFGLVFGFALSRVGASNFDLIYGMFTGIDLTLAGVMGVAIVVGWIGMRILQLTRSAALNRETIAVKSKSLGSWSLAGALLFGLGWGMSGACPGTVLAQVGEGKGLGILTFFGMIFGTYIYALLKESRSDL